MGSSSRNALRRSFFILGLAFTLTSCAALFGPALQGRVSGLLVTGDVKGAAAKITAKHADYGSGNYVLYHLDRGLVLQMSGDAAGSIAALDKAKARSEELYTRSLTKEAATWVVNDNMASYVPPAYERVFINVFQMFNYLQTGDLAGALVEARDLDAKFTVTDGVFQPKRPREDNGFARLLAGILYEAAGTGDDLADARIAYEQAKQVYDAYYGGAYVPGVLQEGLLRLEAYPRGDMAVVYFFESAGTSAFKRPVTLAVPAGDGLVTKVEFPEFVDRPLAAQASRFVLTGQSGRVWEAPGELGADVDDLARRDLEARKAAILAKAVARPGLKYLVERNQRDVIEKHQGAGAADLFGLFSSLYDLVTEQADLRSWQTLPSKVRLARLQVPPGLYRARVEGLDPQGVVVSVQDKGDLELKAGQTYFLITRDPR